jgi:hypothetical protein
LAEVVGDVRVSVAINRGFFVHGSLELLHALSRLLPRLPEFRVTQIMVLPFSFLLTLLKRANSIGAHLHIWNILGFLRLHRSPGILANRPLIFTLIGYFDLGSVSNDPGIRLFLSSICVTALVNLT